MAQTDAQKRATKKYHAKAFKNASCVLKVPQYEALQEVASAEGLTVNALLKRLVLEYIAEHATTEQPEN